MYKLYRNAVLVVGIMVLFIAAIIPPEKKLKLGKDLSGGVSLIYQVQIGPNEDARSILEETRRILKERIDPQGVMEISVTPLGRDRLEITMPLPRDEVKQLRRVYEQALEELGQTNITRARLTDLSGLPAAERDEKFKQLAGSNPQRAAALTKVGELADKSRQLRGELAAAQSAGAEQGAIDALVSSIAAAEVELDSAKDAVQRTLLPAGEVRQALALNKQARTLRDETGTVTLPSPRERALEQLRAKYPDAKEQLEKVLAAYAKYEASRTTLDDPNELKRLVRSSGVLSFRIMVRPGEATDEMRLREELAERGPRGVRSNEAHWYKINQIDTWYDSVEQEKALLNNPAGFFNARGYIGAEYQGQYYLLAWDTRGSRLTPAEGDWRVARAFETRDQTGRPAIGFAMNSRGAILLGELTGAHVNESMAILLDDEIYTAPRLNSAISSNGIIEGDFPPAERTYIIRVLSGGSLQAKISPEPISTSAIGPELGADNLEKGFKAGVLAIIVTSAFMVVYYFGCGVIAVVALFCNALLILGAMALNSAAFTMPGIAGVILTFGMAVDSNVLIYERMREEILRGNDAKTAVRLGFSKALSSIVDGNITNLIVCVVLAYTGTNEIKGFAITMGIGVLATLFSALVISRLLFDLLVNVGGWRRLSMLPLAVPAVQRALTPHFDWLRLRYVFFTVSGGYVLLGLAMVWFQGPKMLDNEFRGGTAITLDFKPTTPGGAERETLTRAEVDERLLKIAGDAPQGSQLALLAGADVLPLDPRDDGVTSDRFTIKTVATDKDLVTEAVLNAFADKLETQAAIAFRAADVTDPAAAPVYRVLGADLSQSINRRVGDVGPVNEYIGGVAVVLENLNPPPTLEILRTRLETRRAEAEFSETLARQRDVFVLEGTPERVTSAVMLVRDDALSFFDNPDRWNADVAQKEWKLAVDGLTVAQTPASVVQFSPAIADTFRAQAIVATVLSFLMITIYIWVRFKGIRFSLAALVALVHDVLTVIGLVAVCELLYEFPATEGIARSVGLLPFKIDLNMVAALLTIAGYSLNDTIVIMDRIRENKGKSPYASYEVINTSINETISRTVITGGTTMLSLLLLYIVGGEGVRAFSFALLVGMFVGTYSSVAVAAPLVWSRKTKVTESADVGRPAGVTA